MTSDLHLSTHETLRVVGEDPAELEVEATWTPGGSAPPAHLHPSQAEHFMVRTGRLTATVAGKTRQLGPGDTLEIRSGTAHRMWNADTQTATALWRTRPAGRTAEWFRTIDRLGEGGKRKPPLPGLAKALIEYTDVFRLVIRPQPLRPFAYLALRAVAFVARREQ